MPWQYKYALKLALQKVLGTAPGLYKLQEMFKHLRGNWAAVTEPSFVLSEAESRITDFIEAGLRPPRVVVEQGTGWHGTDLVLFALSGATQVETFDTTRWLRPELLGAVMKLAPELAPIVARWPGVDLTEARARADDIARHSAAPLEEQLRSLECTQRVTRGPYRPELPDDSVDLFYSNSVLQRVAPDPLRTLVSEAQRFLRHDGQSFHIIDTKDFHSITDARVPQLGYLRWSEAEWRLATSRYLNYQSRLRSPAFIRIFEARFNQTRVVSRLVDPENLDYAQRNHGEDPRFADMSLEELAATQTKLVSEGPLQPHLRQAG